MSRVTLLREPSGHYIRFNTCVKNSELLRRFSDEISMKLVPQATKLKMIATVRYQDIDGRGKICISGPLPFNMLIK